MRLRIVIMGIAIALLSACGDPSPFERANSDDPRVRVRAISDLAEIRGPTRVLREAATAAIIRASKDPEKSVRRIAVSQLRYRGGPKVTAALIAALNASDKTVCRTATDLLGDHHGPKVLAALLAKARSKDRGDVRRAALLSIGDIKDPAAIPGLLRLWADANPSDDNASIAFAASKILAQSELASAARPRILAALRHPNWFVRHWAVFTLYSIADPTTRGEITPC